MIIHPLNSSSMQFKKSKNSPHPKMQAVFAGFIGMPPDGAGSILCSSDHLARYWTHCWTLEMVLEAVTSVALSWSTYFSYWKIFT